MRLSLPGGGLAVRLFVLIVVISAVFTSATVTVQILSDYRREQTAAEKRLDALERSYVPAVSLSVFNFDADQTRLLLEGMSLLQDVAYVEIRERRGGEYVVTESVGETVPQEHIEREFPLQYDYEGEMRDVGRLHVYADLSLIHDRVRDRLTVIVLGSAAEVFLVAFMILFIVQRTLVRPLRLTAGFVRSIELPEDSGRLLTLPGRNRSTRRSDELDEIVRSINDMKDRLSRTYREVAEARDRIDASLEQKTMLLRELYHRTKNNMQVIMSMLSMKAANTPDEPHIRELVADTEARIYAMSLVHEKLYQSRDLSRINMDDYLRELAGYIIDSRQEQTDNMELTIDVQDASVLVDTAIPCGLIVTELISNAVEHALDDSGHGRIGISYARDRHGATRLSVSDSGPGLPDGFDPRADGSMGLQTVYALAEHQLGGRVRFDTDATGATWTVEFRDTRYEARVSQ